MASSYSSGLHTSLRGKEETVANISSSICDNGNAFAVNHNNNNNKLQDDQYFLYNNNNNSYLEDAFHNQKAKVHNLNHDKIVGNSKFSRDKIFPVFISDRNHCSHENGITKKLGVYSSYSSIISQEEESISVVIQDKSLLNGCTSIQNKNIDQMSMLRTVATQTPPNLFISSSSAEISDIGGTQEVTIQPDIVIPKLTVTINPTEPDEITFVPSSPDYSANPPNPIKPPISHHLESNRFFLSLLVLLGRKQL